jgi:hypothetical protein
VVTAEELSVDVERKRIAIIAIMKKKSSVICIMDPTRTTFKRLSHTHKHQQHNNFVENTK